MSSNKRQDENWKTQLELNSEGFSNFQVELIEKVKEILSKQLEVSVDEIQLANSLQEDLGADSLDVVEIVMALEDEFSIEIADEETAKIKTVDDIVKYIDSQK